MDNINILSWNVRGLNSRARRDCIRTLADDAKVSLVCLQETKLDVVNRTTILSTLGINFQEFVYLPAVDTRGGILIAARANEVSLGDLHLGCFTVTVRVHAHVNSSDDRTWWITVVYGPQENFQKGLFMDELAAVCDECVGPWLLIGDFNLILDKNDKNNARINCCNLRLFRRAVAELELQDIHLHGRAYTWSNERDCPTMVKLDRTLASVDWEEMHPSCFLQALASDASDHCPLLLKTNAAPHPKPRFHFEIFWPKLDGYVQAVEAG